EEPLEGVEAEEQPLRVVEPIHGDDEPLDVEPLAELGRLPPDLLVGTEPFEPPDVDADGECLGADAPALPHDRLPVDLRAEEVTGAFAEVLGVALGVEPE